MHLPTHGSLRTIAAALLLAALQACSSPTPAAQPVASTTKKCPKASSSSNELKLVTPVNYEDDIKSIITDNCLSCHGADKGQAPELETYAQVKEARTDVAAAVANESMPKLEALEPADLKLVADWAEDGFREDADSEPVPEDSDDDEDAKTNDTDDDDSSGGDTDDDEDDDDDDACPSK